MNRFSTNESTDLFVDKEFRVLVYLVFTSYLLLFLFSLFVCFFLSFFLPFFTFVFCIYLFVFPRHLFVCFSTAELFTTFV